MYHILVKQERIKNQEVQENIKKEEESEFQEFNFCSHTTSALQRKDTATY